MFTLRRNGKFDKSKLMRTNLLSGLALVSFFEGVNFTNVAWFFCFYLLCRSAFMQTSLFFLFLQLTHSHSLAHTHWYTYGREKKKVLWLLIAVEVRMRSFFIRFAVLLRIFLRIWEFSWHELHKFHTEHCLVSLEVIYLTFVLSFERSPFFRV